jgi:nitroreductase
MQNFDIVIVDDPAILETLAKLRNPISMEFVKENYAQLSFSEEELRQKKIGILATRFPPAWSNPNATSADLAGTDRPLPPSPALLFITENMWLTATALGIGFQIVSSFGSGVVEADVKRILAIPTSLKIVYAIRLGYSHDHAQNGSTGYLRVRRETKDFTNRNRWRQP